MTLEELKKEIAKPHKDYKSVDAKLSNFDDFSNLKPGVGVYAISVDISKIENEKILKCIEENSTQKNVIYIGKVSSRNIFKRCNQDINGTGPATFFRKIGSVLGYKSKSRNKLVKKNNFKFYDGKIKGIKGEEYEVKNDDKKRIKEWNHTNLRLKIFDTDSSNEKDLIQYFKPPFNEEYNWYYTCEEINDLRNRNKGLG